MNDNTEKLIRELAEKLGTTAEHLWSVLIRQAPIDATCSLAIAVAILAGGGLSLMASYRMATAEDTCEEAVFTSGLVGCICILIGLIMLAVDGSYIAAGYFNPEYWALKQVLK